MALRPTPTGYELTSSYFGGGEPSIKSEDRSYAVQNVGLTNQETHEWIHPVGEVVTALVGAGMLIDFLQEHPADDSGLPALFSVRGHVPGRS